MTDAENLLIFVFRLFVWLLRREFVLLNFVIIFERNKKKQIRTFNVTYDLCKWVFQLSCRCFIKITNIEREKENATEKKRRPADLMTYEQLLSPFVLLFISKQKLILLSHCKVGLDFLVECKMKARLFILCVRRSFLLFHGVRSCFCVRHGESVMSAMKTTTSTNYFTLMLQFIIAIISINSIFTWHLAWLHCVCRSFVGF